VGHDIGHGPDIANDFETPKTVAVDKYVVMKEKLQWPSKF
jgi:hypothetical protein